MKDFDRIASSIMMEILSLNKEISHEHLAALFMHLF